MTEALVDRLSSSFASLREGLEHRVDPNLMESTLKEPIGAHQALIDEARPELEKLSAVRENLTESIASVRELADETVQASTTVAERHPELADNPVAMGIYEAFNLSNAAHLMATVAFLQKALNLADPSYTANDQAESEELSERSSTLLSDSLKKLNEPDGQTD